MQKITISQSNRSSIIPTAFILIIFIFVSSKTFSQESFEKEISKITVNMIGNAESQTPMAISLHLKSAMEANNVTEKYRLRRDCFLFSSALSLLAAGGCRLNANRWYQEYHRAVTVDEANSWHKKVRTYDIAAITLAGIGIASLVPAYIYHKKMKLELNAGITPGFNGGMIALRFTY